MKKVLKLMAVVLTIAMFANMGALAAVEGTYAAKNVFTQSFQNLKELPEGWSYQLGGENNGQLNFAVTDNSYLGLTANGSLNLRKTSVYTAENDTYTVTFNIGKPGQQYIYMYVGVDNLTDISASGAVSDSGYTIQYYHNGTNTIKIYKDGAQIGNTMGWVTEFGGYLPNSADIVFTVSKDKINFSMTNGTKSLTQEIANNNPDYTGYIGLALSAINCTTAYVASISATDGYDGIYEDHLFNYVVDSSYTATDLANDGFTYTGKKADYATPIYSWKKSTTDENNTDGIYLGVRDNSTDVRRYGGTLLNSSVLSGDYDVEYIAYFGMNYFETFINYTDDSNRYVLRYGDKIDHDGDGTDTSKGQTAGVKGCCIMKYANSSTFQRLDPVSITKNGEVYTDNLNSSAPIFTYTDKLNKISVRNTEGKLTVTATLYKGDDEYVYTFEDSSNPITSGKFGLSNAAATGTTYVNNIKISSGKIDEAIKQTFAKGSAATLEIPAMLKGDIKILSGIYTDNNLMVGATVKDISAFANSAKVDMFTAEQTENADKMRTFIWSGLDTLFPLTKAN